MLVVVRAFMCCFSLLSGTKRRDLFLGMIFSGSLTIRPEYIASERLCGSGPRCI